MNKKALITTVVIVLVLLGVGTYALTRNSNNDKTPDTSNTNVSQPSSAESTPSNSSSQSNSSNTAPATATITYSDNGFSPATLTVKSGAKITIKNNSSMDMQFDSNPHPAHTDNPELNVGMVAAGQSATFTVTTTGTFGYHNHLNPTDTGTIVVQ